MVDEALGGEAAEQALHNPLFQMQVDDLVVQRVRIFKDHRANRRGPAPFPDPLLALTWGPQGVHRLRPRRISPMPLVHGRKGKPWWAGVCTSLWNGRERLGPHQAQGTRNRRPEMGLVQANTLLGRF